MKPNIPHLQLKDGIGTFDEVREGQMCIMQMVAYLADEPTDRGSVTDHPECADPVLTDFAICLNDRLPEEHRQRLLPFALMLVGTRGDEATHWERDDFLREKVGALEARVRRIGFFPRAKSASGILGEFLNHLARQNRLDEVVDPLLDILRRAILMGPNGADQWPAVAPRAAHYGLTEDVFERVEA